MIGVTEKLAVDVEADAKSWLDDMVDFYQQTGELRIEDTMRLLGDQSRTVYMQPPEACASCSHSLFD